MVLSFGDKYVLRVFDEDLKLIDVIARGKVVTFKRDDITTQKATVLSVTSDILELDISQKYNNKTTAIKIKDYVDDTYENATYNVNKEPFISDKDGVIFKNQVVKIRESDSLLSLMAGRIMDISFGGINAQNGLTECRLLLDVSVEGEKRFIDKNCTEVANDYVATLVEE